MALQVRNFAGIDLKSRLDPFALAQSINIKVIYISDLVELSESSRLRLDVADGWSGGATQDLGDGSHIVILNRKHSPGRLAATLMEEVCHILFAHRLSGISADRDGGRSYNFRIEEEAYSVGAAALVPYYSLKSFLASGVSIRKIAGHFSVTPSLIIYRAKGTKLEKFLV